jgi:orotate phosphoribosyltransferase
MAAGVVIALDRQEKGSGELSAVQEIERGYNMPVLSVATLKDLIGFLSASHELERNLDAVNRYREQYGIQEN